MEIQAATAEPVGAESAEELYRHQNQDGPIGKVGPAFQEGDHERGESAVSQRPDGIEFQQFSERRVRCDGRPGDSRGSGPFVGWHRRVGHLPQESETGHPHDSAEREGEHELPWLRG